MAAIAFAIRPLPCSPEMKSAIPLPTSPNYPSFTCHQGYSHFVWWLIITALHFCPCYVGCQRVQVEWFIHGFDSMLVQWISRLTPKLNIWAECLGYRDTISKQKTKGAHTIPAWQPITNLLLSHPLYITEAQDYERHKLNRAVRWLQKQGSQYHSRHNVFKPKTVYICVVSSKLIVFRMVSSTNRY